MTQKLLFLASALVLSLQAQMLQGIVGAQAPAAGGGTGTFVASAQAQSANANNATTASVDTTGATLLVCGCSVNGTTCTLSDSKSNTWQMPPTGSNIQNGWGIMIGYVFNPTVGTGHSFTATTSGLKPTISCVAFGGTLTTSGVFDAATTHDTAGNTATCAAGLITPASSNSVWFTVAGNVNAAMTTLAANLGFTNLTNKVYNTFGMGQNGAYLIDTGSAAKNPTWTGNDAGNWQKCATATFKTQ